MSGLELVWFKRNIFAQIIRKAEFDLQSALSTNLQRFSLDNDVTVSLGFKSTQNRGLILQNKQLVGTFVCFESGEM